LHREAGRVRIEASVGAGVLEGEGDGAVEALLTALADRHGVRGVIEAFDEFALESGTEAQAMACVKLRVGEESRVGAAFAKDTTSAALQAVLNAMPSRTAVSGVAAHADTASERTSSHAIDPVVLVRL
jgi:2-isopropylmalate synthase